MRYYVVADTHGFYSEMIEALTKKGFFEDEKPHKLIIVGDLLDRGQEALKLQAFVMDLLKKDLVILIRGNHEDLMLEMLDNYSIYRMKIASGLRVHHVLNGTFDTALQLSGFSISEALLKEKEFVGAVRGSDFYKTIIPNMLDFFETEHYIFTHGYLPIDDYGNLIDFHLASPEEWVNARWLNGMEMACVKGQILGGKTVVCGHFHTSYGHSRINNECSEFGSDAIFTPFSSEGIMAIDSCCAHTGFINCIVIED